MHSVYFTNSLFMRLVIPYSFIKIYCICIYTIYPIDIIFLLNALLQSINSPGFLCIVCQGIVLNPRFLLAPQIPVTNYIKVTVLFFTSNVCNNVALSYDVDMPTLVVIRSGSLVANMAVSLIAFRRHYPASKYVSVAMVTVGVLLSTAATAQLKTSGETSGDLGRWSFGMLLLLFGLFGSATTGVFQEKLFTTFGKHPKEALFYSHFLGIFGFLISYQNIAKSVVDFSNSPPMHGVPSAWVYCSVYVGVLNVCMQSIYYLLSEWSSLAVTLVTTVRKFLSLILSIVLFGNPFTVQHWLAAALVFTGSAIYTELIQLQTVKLAAKRLGLPVMNTSHEKTISEC